MQFKPLEETTGEPRYDAETLRQVTALAQQLQDGCQEGLTAGQIEEIGEEVGLGRAFVREALRQLALQQSQGVSRRDRTRELMGLLVGGAVGALWTLLAWVLTTAGAGAAGYFFLFVPPVLAGALGGAIYLRRAATRGAAPEGAVSSPALLGLLVTVQRQLAQQARRRAFLSIEVVGARELRRDASEAAAAHSFSQLQEWVEGLVRRAGGECRGTVEDGLICTFASDSAAVSVARELQEGMGRFNTERNRMASPFRLRCGLHAGAVVTDEGPLQALQSALIERAVELQRQADPGDILVSGELAAAALVELRSLAPLGLEAGAAPVFSWRAGQRAQQRP